MYLPLLELQLFLAVVLPVVVGFLSSVVRCVVLFSSVVLVRVVVPVSVPRDFFLCPCAGWGE